ncbi:muts domain V-domain-containing protein [Phlebopus sp. FC_14]|nr:muts domain V-domain-containing protein [Phlebopus sp. FC_14]
MSRKTANPSTNSQDQPRISSFFSQQPSPKKKRLHGTENQSIDLTLDESEADEQPPIKKLKVKQNRSVAEQWRFDSTQRSSTNTHLDEKKKRRHEEFKRVLLGENSVFARRDRTQGAEGAQSDGDVSHDEQEVAGDSDESDVTFKQLTDMFSHKPRKRKIKAQNGSSSKIKKRVEEELGPSGEPYTPAERQSLKFIKDNPGVVLMIESGYKFYSYEESATQRARHSGLSSSQSTDCFNSGPPALLSQGYKVGIVEQIETAALKKASENRNALFERKLTHLYTATTYVDELGSLDDLDRHAAPPLVCFAELPRRGESVEDQVSIGMIAITPSTGDVIWDEFDGTIPGFIVKNAFTWKSTDSVMRSELETRLVHIRPAELILPEHALSKLTEKVLNHFAGSASSGQKIRIERYRDPMPYTKAFDFVTEFYSDKKKVGSEDQRMGILLTMSAERIQVVITLAHAIRYLSAFSIADAFLGARFFTKFAHKTHMLLNANTLTNLEVYQNQTDYTTTGSLLWILDRTTTKFGARLLKSWVGRPLTDQRALQERIDAVEEIVTSSSEKLVALRQVLKKLPDLAKGLCRIQYGKCTPQELATLLPAFNKVATVFDSFEGPLSSFRSRILNEIALSLPRLKSPTRNFLDAVSLKDAADGKKESLWTDSQRFPTLVELQLMIRTVESELTDELKRVRKILRMPSLQWTSILGIEYIVEVKKSENREVPVSWELVSRWVIITDFERPSHISLSTSTKYSRRYHTPEVKKLIQERARYKESLAAEANKAYHSFLEEIVQSHYTVLRDAVNKLAVADCLLSLAHVALQDGYTRPELTDDDVLEIVDGRHPMVEALRSDPFVPNTITIGGTSPRSVIITGPNMGGKSSAVRMVALIAIMAQIGSYVPARAARIGMCDGIITRMGASDELARGRSTFMVEMAETNDILKTASSRSLVILDELGRGTSTADGMAIADAVLQHLVENIKCKTLFITHYPLVAIDLERMFPDDVQNLHMGYTTDTRIDGRRDVTFLYRLTRGFAEESFGVECARLAGIPEHILSVATERSEICRASIESRSRLNRFAGESHSSALIDRRSAEREGVLSFSTNV